MSRLYIIKMLYDLSKICRAPEKQFFFTYLTLFVISTKSKLLNSTRTESQGTASIYLHIAQE